MATPPPPVEDAVPRSPSVILEDAPSTTTRTIGGCWVIDKRIGRGSFATVWRARHLTSESHVVAVKEIYLEKLSKKLRQSLESEIEVLRQSDHPNIIKLYDIIRDPGDKVVHLVLEYCDGGDVGEYIKRNGSVDEATARGMLTQMAAGLTAMRAKNLIHRDLKPQNLLLTSAGASGDGEKILKIADFGFARYMHPTGLAETLCGASSNRSRPPRVCCVFQKLDDTHPPDDGLTCHRD